MGLNLALTHYGWYEGFAPLPVNYGDVFYQGNGEKADYLIFHQRLKEYPDAVRLLRERMADKVARKRKYFDAMFLGRFRQRIYLSELGLSLVQFEKVSVVPVVEVIPVDYLVLPAPEESRRIDYDDTPTYQHWFLQTG